MFLTAIVTAREGEVAAAEEFLKSFEEVGVCSVKGDEILIIIDAESEFIERFLGWVMENKSIINFLHHSYHFL
ncbi:MAG: hypothetical protein LBD73_07275 [Deferribacteraceae bacterium]|jgi:hypothetical protein|nr:hypothetical protein [Deferribacteraceae bacterium]